MATEYKLNYTAEEINEKLSKSGASHWDDLEGKPFGEKAVVKLVDNANIDCVDAGGGNFGLADNPFSIQLEMDKSYTVVFDEEKYECVPSAIPNAPSGAWSLGNAAFMGAPDDTGEPFLIVCAAGVTQIASLLIGKHTISIVCEEVTPIPTEMLPEALRFGESEKNILIGHKFEEEGFSELTVNDGDNPRVCAGNLLVTTFNPAKSYTVVIRGDRYEDLTPSEPYRNYYWWTVWGGYSYVAGGSGGENEDKPFALVCEHFNQDFTSVSTVKLEIDTVVYPNITIEEVQIYEIELTTINEKYLPEELRMPAAVVVGEGELSTVQGYETTASGYYSHAEGHSTIASSDSAHAEGRETAASGMYSHAEGYKTTASGKYSHAEGDYATAASESSHAEGHSTNAEGRYSHTEGYATNAKGLGSHAEGASTHASGKYSHAEGNKAVASGEASHAEGYHSMSYGTHSHAEGSGYGWAVVYITGTADTYAVSKPFGTKYDYSLTVGKILNYNGLYYKIVEVSGSNIKLDKSITSETFTDKVAQLMCSTTASGDCSHAEGLETVAAVNAQHVQGKYNIVDASDKYAHIVGNGEADAARSNAHTLDWNGNAWFAGGIELTSPNGTRYRFTVSDDGTLSSTVVTE